MAVLFSQQLVRDTRRDIDEITYRLNIMERGASYCVENKFYESWKKLYSYRYFNKDIQVLYSDYFSYVSDSETLDEEIVQYIINCGIPIQSKQ